MEVSAERLIELKQSFDYNDSNRDGMISLEEFVNLLGELEAETSIDEAKLGFTEIDSNRDGSISLDEFVEWWCGR